MGGGQQGDHAVVDALLAEHFADEPDARLIRSLSVAAALQRTGITTLETEGEDIEGDVGSRLIDHADDAEGHAHAMDAQAVGQRAGIGHQTQGRGQLGHVAHVGRDGLESRGRELQAIVERILRVHPREVLAVGLQELLLPGNDGIGHAQQHVAPLLFGDSGQRLAGRLHTLESLGHLHTINSV